MDTLSKAFNDSVDGVDGFGRRIVHVNGIAKCDDCTDCAFVHAGGCKFVNDILRYCSRGGAVTALYQYCRYIQAT